MVEKKEWIEPIRAAHSHDPDALTQGAAMSCGRHHHDDDIKVLEGLSSPENESPAVAGAVMVILLMSGNRIGRRPASRG